MKGERRHELQHNDLAEWIVRIGKGIQPYQNHLLALVVAAVVGMIAFSWWSRSTAQQDALAWQQVQFGLATRNFNQLAQVANDNPNSEVGATALVVAADLRLINGCDQLFISKAPANEQLNHAVQLYDLCLKQTASSMLTQRATFGLARAYEARGELAPAQERYSEVVKKWPEGAYAAIAQQRLDNLARPETKRMYDAFAKFDPKPDFSDLPEQPSDALPALPVEPMPGLPDEPAPETDAPTDAKQPTEPKQDAEQPSEANQDVPTEKK